MAGEKGFMERKEMAARSGQGQQMSTEGKARGANGRTIHLAKHSVSWVTTSSWDEVLCASWTRLGLVTEAGIQIINR